MIQVVAGQGRDPHEAVVHWFSAHFVGHMKDPANIEYAAVNLQAEWVTRRMAVNDDTVLLDTR